MLITSFTATLGIKAGVQADVSGLAQHQQEVDNADPELERGAESVSHPVRRQSPDGRPQLKLTYTDRLELPEAANLAALIKKTVRKHEAVLD